jgi:hypothetical protein
MSRAPRLSYVARIPGNRMPALKNPPPIDAGRKQTITLDFGDFLPAGVTLAGTPAVGGSMVSGPDVNPASRITSGPTIGPAPSAEDVSGAASAAILVQLQPMAAANNEYLVWGYCARSDGTGEVFTLSSRGC